MRYQPQFDAVERDLARYQREIDRDAARELAVERRMDELSDLLRASDLYEECTPREWNVILDAIKRIAERDVDNYTPDEPDCAPDWMEDDCCGRSRWRA